jgi:hypothetical protein
VKYEHHLHIKSKAIPVFVGKPEGKRPLGKPRRRWIDNIKMDLLEIGLSVVDLIEPSGSIKCWETRSGCTTCGLSSGAQLQRVSQLVIPVTWREGP